MIYPSLHFSHLSRVFALIATVITLQISLAPPAVAVPILHYEIGFTPTMSNTPLPTASFDYDSGLQQFSNFIVAWNGNNYDFTLSAATPFDGTAADVYSSMCSSSGAPLSFKFLMNDTCFSSIQNYTGPKWYFLTQQNGTHLKLHTGYSPSEDFGLEVIDPNLIANGETYGIGTFVVSSGDPVSQVPVPGTLLLLLLGGATLPLALRRSSSCGVRDVKCPTLLAPI